MKPVLSSEVGVFATGSCACSLRPAAAGDTLGRLFVPITIENLQTDAVIDTGGAYLILDPEIAIGLELDSGQALIVESISIRGTQYSGALYRMTLSFRADIGQDLSLEATVFVPSIDQNPVWGLPNFLGWHGCLERLRFGIDPVAELFYFGSPDS